MVAGAGKIEGYQTATLITGAQLRAFSLEAAGGLVSLGNVPDQQD